MGAGIAVDFDNTIVSYDELIHRVAVEIGLIPGGPVMDKAEARRRIRELPAGEIAWQKLQAAVYGPRIGEAKLMDGVAPFFQECKGRGYPVYIVSHKTEYATQDTTGTNLRNAAIGWMADHGFFQEQGLGLSSQDIYFEATRKEKLHRIKTLGCSILVDDLEETFLEPTFPAGVEKILFAPNNHPTLIPGVKCFSSWEEIAGYVFHDLS